MKKLIIFILLFSPFVSLAATPETDFVFKAIVSEIVEEETFINEDEKRVSQQNLQLLGLEDERKNKEYFFKGINEFEVLKNPKYKIGDKVLLLESLNDKGEAQYYVVDYIRTNTIYYLFAIFVIILLFVGKLKGARSLVSLFLTFFVITKFIIPKILLGSNPLFITLTGSFLILFIIIYITEGFRPMSHLAFLSISISLSIAVFLSWAFVLAGKLSGIFSEEVASLAIVNGLTINFQGLLLAGIIIGLLGVLDDVVIAQVSTVEQIYLTDKQQSKKSIFSKSYQVGVSHISSMTNTLFLAYAGASLPLLVLFVSGESVFLSTFDAINNEQIATEIVRTLAGSIGLILSVPISTFLAVAWYKK